MTTAAATSGKAWGIVAEFDSAAAIYEAAKRSRPTAAGYRRVDSHTPFPIHGIDKAPSSKGRATSVGSSCSAVSPASLRPNR